MKSALSRKWGLTPFLVIILFLSGCKKNDGLNGKAMKSGFAFEETTIAGIHKAIKSGQITCRQLVENYLVRVPAGSSGGTAAAVAANFGAVGLGTDTGNSIRGPSSHCCLVGIRSTMGLTSRDGIIPLYLRNDIGGPMARTVEDALKILEVIAGYDPADSITEKSIDKIPDSYTQFLDKKGLRGARIGVFRYYTDRSTTDMQIIELLEKAIDDMRSQGAEIVDPFIIPNFKEMTKNIWCDMFRYDLNNYLESLGDKAPFKTLADIVNTGLYSPYIKKRLKRALEVPLTQNVRCQDLYQEPRNIAFREAVLKAMDEHRTDSSSFAYKEL